MTKLCICILVLLPALPASSAKDSVPSLPSLLSHYNLKEALVDLFEAGDVAARERLRAWSLHHSFGGERLGVSGLEQPRAAQALWLVLTTHAIELKQLSPSHATDMLSYLHQQKALSSSTVAFFTQLWHDRSIQPQRAADFLRGWLQEQEAPALSPAEAAAIQTATRAGCSALACFEKNLPAAQSTTKP